MKSFFNVLTIALVFSLVSCSSNIETDLNGLWQSNVDKSKVLLKARESITDEQREVVSAELGNLYHYFSRDEFYLIYSPSLSPINILELIESKGLDRLPDGEFAKRFEISDVDREKNHIQLTLDGNNGPSVLVLDLDRKHDCYIVDNSQYGDFAAEIFCKIGNSPSTK